MDAMRLCAQCSKSLGPKQKLCCSRTCNALLNIARGTKFVDAGDERKCRTCGLFKSRVEAFKRSKRNGGFATECKACEKAYRDTNPDVTAATAARHYAKIKADPALLQKERARKLALANRWYLANREEGRRRARERARLPEGKKRARAYRLAHPAQFAAYMRGRRASAPERYLALSKRWRAANRAKVNASAKAYRKRHPEKRMQQGAARRAKVDGATIQRITASMLRQRAEVFGNACAYCGGPHEHWDHVIPLSRGGKHCLSNLRPACAKCNLTKHAKKLSEWKKKAA